DEQRVADRLAHLLAGDVDHRIVHPEPGERSSSGAGLGELVLMVRKPQVEAATVDVELVAEILARYGRALQMPARPATPVRAGPRGGVRLPFLVTFPQREIARVPFGPRVGVGGRFHLVELLPGQLTVRRPRPDVEVDVAG